MKMKLIHPTYFPNIHTFSFIANESICWELEDNYQKQTFRNRTYISTDRGKHILSIPIVHVGKEFGRQRYKSVALDHTYPWQRQHWRTLETAYRTSPFFEFYEDEIRPLYTQPFDLLMDFNLKTIEVILDCLQLQMPSETTSSYEDKPALYKDYRFLVNAKLDHDLHFEPYTQVFGDRHGFIPNLSILDLLFNLGPNALSYLKQGILPKTHG
ncbi:WbqC family protein [Maribacter sedimenticola]|nr:WbqC family protein [Maribacter sedimenticola]